MKVKKEREEKWEGRVMRKLVKRSMVMMLVVMMGCGQQGQQEREKPG
ncbi:hypothetical protein [Borrelia persica]|nr:hypothetical protein [Borrelia persica]